MTEVAPSFDKGKCCALMPVVFGPESSAAGLNGKPPHFVAAVTTKMAQQNHLSDGPSHLGVAPKPVEVTSVPETPVNGGQTPVGGTPRPELKITEDESEQKETPKEAPVILGPNTEKKPSAPEPVSDVGGPDHLSSKPTAGATDMGDSTPVGEKRKVEEETKPATKDEPEKQANESVEHNEERPEKKAKVTDRIADAVDDIKEKVESKLQTNGKKKPGRPKKDKSAPPPVGKTQRKTRSQGPIE
ncbi:unnamed protein product [Clonostachys rhizophaga]|uniref:Uncharacterized protein n=1 Tax=Clonostachys rhizophaga TaxID=160324 RepID=A0A9N9YGN3_9HYPO|nr:unnamed protein product [Clonostachys rhizophaga]